jgi:hypothetical protein
MSQTSCQDKRSAAEPVPAELQELRERICAQPVEVRTELEPLIDEAVEHARFRGRVITLARDALERFRLDLTMKEFDLEATRREREELRALLG